MSDSPVDMVASTARGVIAKHFGVAMAKVDVARTLSRGFSVIVDEARFVAPVLRRLQEFAPKIGFEVRARTVQPSSEPTR